MSLKRTDAPQRLTTTVSGEVAELIKKLAPHLADKEKRSAPLSQGEVIEQAVRLLARREKVTG